MSDPIPNYPLLQEIAVREWAAGGRVNLSYLEIGVCEGGSAEVVLQTDRIRHAVLIDFWKEFYGGSNRGSPMHVVKRLEKWMDRVTIISGDSHVVLPTLEAQFDLIYVDGDHSAMGAQQDIEDSYRLLAPQGVMLVDDIDNEHHPYIRNIVEDFAARNSLDLKTHAVHTGMAEMRRKL